LTSGDPAVVSVPVVACVLDVVGVHAVAGVPALSYFPGNDAGVPAFEDVVDKGQNLSPVSLTPVKNKFGSKHFWSVSTLTRPKRFRL